MEDEFASIWDVVDRWCRKSDARDVMYNTTDDTEHILMKKADENHGEVTLFGPDKTKVNVILDLDKGEFTIDTELLFFFADGVRVTKEIKGFPLMMFSEIDRYAKRVINPALDEMLNNGK